jgi:hypothetical protein
MSLTSALRNRKSPVSRFLLESFPDVRPLQKAWRESVATARTIRPIVPPEPPWGTIGQAIDYRLRYYFGVTPPESLVAGLGASFLTGIRRVRRSDEVVAVVYQYDPRIGPSTVQDNWQNLVSDFFRQVAEVTRRLQPVGRRLPRSQEDLLCRYCFVLALFEELYRVGLIPSSPLLMVGPSATVSDLLSLANRWVSDLRELSWAFIRGHAGLLSRQAVLNPTFGGSAEVGGADADVIVDRYLIEFKTTISPVTLQRIWFDQMLGYVLLDYDDAYALEGIGIYLTRQAMLIRWSLKEILDTLCVSRTRSLAGVRAGFREAVGQMPRLMVSGEALTRRAVVARLRDPQGSRGREE